MKVILKEDIKNLGKKGKVCEVSDGYARNFLIPKGLVMEATEGNVQDLAHKQKQEGLRKLKEKQAALDLQEKIQALDLVVRVKVGEKGRLFGSVTNKEIAEVLENQYKIKLDKRKIEMKEPIRTTGAYGVAIKLHPEVTASVTIKVDAVQ